MTRPLRTFVVLGLAAAATACASPREEISRNLKTPMDQFPFVVDKAPDETLLAVHPGGVSPGQAAALSGVTRRWRDGGGDEIIIRTPAGVPSEGMAAAMAEQVRGMLIGAGTPVSLVRVEAYDPAGDAAAPLVVAFARYQAQIPVCGETWDNLAGTQSNSVPNTFGCSVSANMAAQVANPRDLIEARGEAPIESSRRTVQTDLYRRGDSTASKVTQQGGVVSKAVP
jgi:pilus assembly protein CpaD